MGQTLDIENLGSFVATAANARNYRFVLALDTAGLSVAALTANPGAAGANVLLNAAVPAGADGGATLSLAGQRGQIEAALDKFDPEGKRPVQSFVVGVAADGKPACAAGPTFDRAVRAAKKEEAKPSGLRDKILEIARREVALGVVEDPKGSNVDAGGHIAKYLRAAGINSPAEWCASFVTYAYTQAGAPIQGSASSTTLYNSFKAEGRLLGAGDTPKPGDVFFERSASDASKMCHVGLVESAAGAVAQTIEGNYSSSLMRASTKGRDIAGWGRVE